MRGSRVPLTAVVAASLSACAPVPPPSPEQELVARGRDLFVNGTFGGNGRTCATCHPATNNFTIDPEFIATVDGDDPLFLAETDPDLARGFENPRLMRGFGLILENQDGFDDLENDFNMRGVPHTLALPGSVADTNGDPLTGWSGDGAPGDGSLRSFAIGAVIQHFTKTTARVAGVDFQLPTEEELDAMEAFQLSLGRQEELALPLPLKGTVAIRGQEIFLDPTLGKCNICHQNAGAVSVVPALGINGNANFDTGVESLPDQPQDLTGELVPPDDGLGAPGDGTFNTPPLVEAADTGPFFHNNSVETIEGAVAFYNGEAFANSPIGRIIASADPNGVAIRLDATQVVEVAAFLRVINALENVRQAIELLALVRDNEYLGGREPREIFEQARAETADAVEVLDGGGLHPDAVARLREAEEEIFRGTDRRGQRRRAGYAREAIEDLEAARGRLVDAP